jgi:hypothetical protein
MVVRHATIHAYLLIPVLDPEAFYLEWIYVSYDVVINRILDHLELAKKSNLSKVLIQDTIFLLRGEFYFLLKGIIKRSRNRLL